MPAALSRALDCYLETTYPSPEVWNLEEKEEWDCRILYSPYSAKKKKKKVYNGEIRLLKIFFVRF